MYFNDGYNINGKNRKCTALNVGLAPSGLVTVWAVCDSYNIEIVHFKVEEIGESVFSSPLPRWRDGFSSMEEYAKHILSYETYKDLRDYLSDTTIEAEITLYERSMERFNTGFKGQL